MDLAEVKAVKHALGGTVNDVVLAVVSGALRRFLVRRRVDVDGLELRAMVPVSVRAEHERGGLGNRVAGWLTPLPVGEGDARRRLACVREQTKHLKDSKQAMATETLASVTDWTSSTVLSVAIQLALRVRPFNLVVTNVPGPQVPLYLLGARMQEVYPQVPLFTNQGLGIALFSYDGTLFWGFNADWDLVPDLADLVDDVRASFAELHRASRLPRPRRRPIARPSSGEHKSNRASIRK
jgi:WS/DGAT/MGAT family acyltransferase